MGIGKELLHQFVVTDEDVSCLGFIPRAMIIKTIPIIASVMPEKNEAAGNHQYHGKGQLVARQSVPDPVRPPPPTMPIINRKIPMTMSAKPKV